MELNVSEFVNESRHEIITIKQNKTGIGHTYYLYTVHTDKWQGENVLYQPGMVTNAWPFIFPFINLKVILGPCFSWNLMKRETKSASDTL